MPVLNAGTARTEEVEQAEIKAAATLRVAHSLAAALADDARGPFGRLDGLLEQDKAAARAENVVHGGQSPPAPQGRGAAAATSRRVGSLTAILIQ